MKNLIIFFFLVLFGCKTAMPSLISVDRSYKARDRYYSYSLSLLANKTFKYSERGAHHSHLYTDGIWNLTNDTLILQTRKLDSTELLMSLIGNGKRIEFNNVKAIFKSKKIIFVDINKPKLKITVK